MPITQYKLLEPRKEYLFYLFGAVFLGACPAAAVSSDIESPGIAGLRCEIRSQDGEQFEVVTIDLRCHQLRLYWQDASGTPYASLQRLESSLQEGREELLFATNAGIYARDYRPMGLHVENGTELHPLSRGSGGGNFFLKPNGVFSIQGGRASILETEKYVASHKQPDLAVQSGPLLLDDSRIHPRFLPDSDSRFLRNGVGTVDEHLVCFVLSRAPVNFYDFARFFRDVLHCRNALYLDGSLSAMYAPCLERPPLGGIFVGILAVTRPMDKVSMP